MGELEEQIERIAERVFNRRLDEVSPSLQQNAGTPVTLRKASEVTGIPVTTLEKWVTQGRLRTYPCVGRLRMVKLSDIVSEE
jgi:hypothetical protein